MLNYSIREYENNRVLDLSGNLSANTVDLFTDITKGIIEKESLIINFENVKIVTSAGIYALVDISFIAKENNNRAIILWPSEDLIKLAEVLEVYHFIVFAYSFEESQKKIAFFT